MAPALPIPHLDGMSDTHDATESRLVTGLWQVVAAHGWQGVTLRRLAAATGLAAADIRVRCPGGPRDLLALQARLLDEAVASGTVPGQGGTPRDRIFDVLMRRIDAMQPHRAGMLRFLDELRTDPGLALCLVAGLPRSMARLLETAEIEGWSVGRSLTGTPPLDSAGDRSGQIAESCKTRPGNSPVMAGRSLRRRRQRCAARRAQGQPYQGAAGRRLVRWRGGLMDLDGGAGFDRDFLAEQVNPPPTCDLAELLGGEGASARKVTLTRISAQLVRGKGSVDFVAEGAVAPPGDGGVVG